MVPENFYNEYKQNAVSTSSQGQLILMMYEGAIKFLNLALQSHQKNDISNKSLYIRKTHDIVNELSCCLDAEKGGDVAGRLENLYQFMLRQLTLGNIKPEAKPLEDVKRLLIILNEAWQKIIVQEESAGHAPAPTVPGASANPTQPNRITSHC